MPGLDRDGVPGRTGPWRHSGVGSPPPCGVKRSALHGLSRPLGGLGVSGGLCARSAVRGTIGRGAHPDAREGWLLALAVIERLGFAGWFGAAIWFSAFGTSTLFGNLGPAGASASLDVLFASLFWFCAACGAVALAGALGTRSRRLGGLRIAMAAVVLAGGLALSLAVEPWFLHTQTAAAFSAAHTTSFVVTLIAWLASGVGLAAERG